MNPVLLVGIFSQYLTSDILSADSEGNLWGKKPQQIKTPQNATQNKPSQALPPPQTPSTTWQYQSRSVSPK